MSPKSLLLFVILLVGCTAVPDTDIATAVSTRTPQPTQMAMPMETAVITPSLPPASTAPTAEIEGMPIADDPTQLPVPGPTAVSPHALTLGQPFWLGRGQIVDAAFLPGGDQLLIGWANTLALVNVADATELWQLTLDVPILDVTTHPQGEAVAALLSNGALFIVDALTGEVRQFTNDDHRASWGDIAWSPDGRTIAYQFNGSSRQSPITLLDVSSGAISELRGTVSAHTQPYLVWSPDSQLISQASLEGGCGRFVNVTTGETAFTLAHANGCYSPYALAWSPGGRTLAVVSYDGFNPVGAVNLLDPLTGNVIRQIEGQVMAFGLLEAGDPLMFSADGRYLLSRGGVGYYNEFIPLMMWEAETGQLVVQFGEAKDFDPVAASTPRLAVWSDGRQILSFFTNGKITRWQPENAPAEEVASRVSVVVPETFVWSADGRKIAATTRDGGAAVWDVAGGQLQAIFERPEAFGGAYNPPSISADGRFLALDYPQQQQIIIYDLDTGAAVTSLAGATALPDTAFSPAAGGYLGRYAHELRVPAAVSSVGRSSFSWLESL